MLACRMEPVEVRTVCLQPANDDAGQPRQEHLRDALRLFAQHGLTACEHARDRAMAAARRGDRQAFDRWFGICRALDRRMAARLANTAEAVR